MKKLEALIAVDKAEQELEVERGHLSRAHRELEAAQQDQVTAQAAYDVAAHRHFVGEISAEEEEQARAKVDSCQARVDRLRRTIPIQEQRVKGKGDALAEAKSSAVPAVLAAGQAQVDPLLDQLFEHYEGITVLREQLNGIHLSVLEQCRALGAQNAHTRLDMNLLPRIEDWNKRTGKRLFLS